jgi:hypothetical protein
MGREHTNYVVLSAILKSCGSLLREVRKMNALRRTALPDVAAFICSYVEILNPARIGLCVKRISNQT